MKKYLLPMAGLAILILLFWVPGFAQKIRTEPDKKDTLENHMSDYDEIIIKRKDNKDTKVTIEIKEDGEVFVDGKPVSDYNNDNLSIRKKKVRVLDGRAFSFSGPDGAETLISPGDVEMPEMPELRIAPSSPFRNHSGTWNFSGNVNRAVLGVNSERPGGDATGAKIKQVTKGSGAEKAGLHEGDLITRVDEIPVDGPESLSKAIHKYKPEDKVTITFKRDGKEQKATATLGKSNTAEAYSFSMPKMEDFNYETPMPDRIYGFNRSQARLGIKAQDTEDGKGVKVLDVDDESAAEKAGIKEGDIITTFDGKEVNSVTALAELARASKAKVSVKVNLLRDGKSQEVEVKTPRKLKTADL
jgi:serine protease Do